MRAPQLAQAANNVTRVQIRIRIKHFWRYNILNSVIPVSCCRCTLLLWCGACAGWTCNGTELPGCQVWQQVPMRCLTPAGMPNLSHPLACGVLPALMGVLSFIQLLACHLCTMAPQVALLGVLSFVVFFLDCKELATRLGEGQRGSLVAARTHLTAQSVGGMHELLCRRPAR